MISLKANVLLILFSLLSLTMKGQDPVRMFIFGHSLLDHRPPIIPTPSDETTVPHWLNKLGDADNIAHFIGGQYGFLPQHRRTPPISQWGYNEVPGVWESDTETFAEAEINTIVITAGNFMQWQGPEEEYVTDPGVSPVSATGDIVDWVDEQSDLEVKYYIYENWPDMAPFLGAGFPPSSNELTSYLQHTQGEFHEWWIDYHDRMLQTHPEINIRMIPVGPILSDIIIDILGEEIPATELYEDDAPHGRASLYFLASTITYMAIAERRISSSYSVPDIVHTSIRNRFPEIVDRIWIELNHFNLGNGKSRVFYDQTSSVLLATADHTTLYPTLAQDIIFIESDMPQNVIVTSVDGRYQKEYKIHSGTNQIDIHNLDPGMYYVMNNTYGTGVVKFVKNN